MVRIGRYTSALSLTALGILLLLDHAGKLDVLAVLRVWWPAALVALGLELIILQSLNRHQPTRAKIAFGTLFGAAVLGSFVLVAARGSDIHLSQVQRWTEGFSLGFYDSDRAKHSFDKGTITIPLRDSGQKVTISAVNGHVTLGEGPVSDIEVKAVVYINESDRSEAEKLAEKSGVQVKDEDGIEIVGYGEPYGTGDLRRPRVDIAVTFPQGSVPSDVDVRVGSGSVTWDRLYGVKELTLDVKNGKIAGAKTSGWLHAKLLNGDIRLSELNGASDLEIINGTMDISQASAAVKAKTVNGDISIGSSSVGGNWDVSSTMGKITLAWPENADVDVTAKTNFGEIETDWPLNAEDRKAYGKLGSGAWRISIDTKADVVLKKFTP